MVQHKGGFITRKVKENPVKQEDKPRRHGTPLPAKNKGEMGMRQLFDEESGTFSYLLWDKETEDAILIDPVDTQVKRDLLVATTLHLLYVVNTHVHSTHISGATRIKKKVKNARSVISKASLAKADEYLSHGDELHFGNRYITALATPGVTDHCLSFLLDDGKAVLTGDALWVMGCGRTDLQCGSAETLYESVQQELFTLPEDTIVFPGHENDFDNVAKKTPSSSTIGQEKTHNPRLGGDKSKEECVQIMEDHNQELPRPSKMDICVPANRQDGAKPFFVRALRTHLKQRWGVFG